MSTSSTRMARSQIRLAEGGTPAWSPDGKQIAFSFGFNGFFGDVVDIHAIDINGENRVNLTQGKYKRELIPDMVARRNEDCLLVQPRRSTGHLPDGRQRDESVKPHSRPAPRGPTDLVARRDKNRIWSAAAPARRKKLVGHLRNGCRWRESHQRHPKPRSRESISGVVSRWKEDCVRGIAPSQSLVSAL